MVLTDLTRSTFVEQLNEDIKQFPQVHPITSDMHITHKGVSRLVMIDRYSFKDTAKKTLKVGDFVVLTVKQDPKFPARGLGFIQSINEDAKTAQIIIEEEYRGALETAEEKRQQAFEQFYEQLVSMKFIPAGRVIYGAGSNTDVTFFNCYVMPFIADS